MKVIGFGHGEIGVEATYSNTPSIFLYELENSYKVGTNYTEKTSNPTVQLLFLNEKGLNVLIEALEKCRKSFHQTKVPSELRMGA